LPKRGTNKWLALAITSLGSFAATFNSGSVNILNPVLAGEFGLQQAQVQWVMTLYLLIVSSLMLLFGQVSDRVGSHRIYIVGVFVFTAGSLFCGFSPAFLPLLIGRSIQAVGAAMMLATSMALMSTVFPPNQRGMALGLSVLMIGLGNMSGPALGGLILAVAPWPVLFLVNVPIGLASFLMAAVWLRSPVAAQKQSPPFDIIGALLMIAVIASLILFFSGGFEGSRWFGLLLLVAFPLFLIFERRHKAPLLDFALLRSRRFSLGNLVSFFSYTAVMMLGFQLPFLLEDVWMMPVGQAGLLLTVSAISMAVSGPISGMVSDRFGAMRVMPAALAASTVAVGLAMFLGAHLALPLFIACTALNGLGMGFLNTPNNSEIMGAASREKSGYAGGFVSMNRNLAFCIGTSLSAGVFHVVEGLALPSLGAADAHLAGMRAAFAVAAVLLVISLAVCLYLRSRRYRPDSTAQGNNLEKDGGS
jgi:EmrB/QacA subfamily drug resistance transporter